MKRIKLQFVLGVALLITGALILITSIRNQQTSIVVPNSTPTSATQQATPNPAQPAAITGQPAQLVLPSLGLDLPVIPGVYNPKTKTWTLSLDKVQYATMTPEPNTVEGNTFIYGHYRKGVLATLHTIQPGAQAIVKTSNGHTFYYQLASQRTTVPTDVSVLSYTGKPILTIQTCAGLFFQNRQLFTFDLVRAV